MSETVSKRSIVRFEGGINLGQIVQILMTAGFLAWIVMGYLNRVDTAQSDVRQLQADVKALRGDVTGQNEKLRIDVGAQLTALQAANNEQFRTLRTDIANLPEVRADMTQFTRRTDQADSRADAQSKRMDNIEKTGIQNAADMVNMLRTIGGARLPR